MKILYGINTNGQGHINRARIFIEELIKDGHEVQVLLTGKKPPEYAFNLVPVTYFKTGPIDIYKDNKLSYSKSLQVNIVNIGNLTKNRRDILELVEEENYDALFTDFEPMTSFIGKVLKKPVICIDHQHSAFHPANEEAPAKQYYKLGLKFAMKVMVPYFSHCFSIDFVDKIETVDNMTLFPLVWKPEFNNYQITVADHYLVYLARYNKQKMMKVLEAFPETKFIVYGFNLNETIGNVVFKSTSREEFLKDLASCKGVISNGGFSLSWECCLLHKVLWMIPHPNNYEQYTNAYRLQKMKRAFVSEDLTKENMNEFFTEAKKQNFKPAFDLPVLLPSALLDMVYTQLNYQLESKKKENKKRRN
ncbi:MAG: glycosyltransferase family protein [Candidatus Thorarchaeota archaeon]